MDKKRIYRIFNVDDFKTCPCAGVMPTMLLEREAAYNNQFPNSWRNTFSELQVKHTGVQVFHLLPQRQELKEERFTGLSTSVAEYSSNEILNRSDLCITGVSGGQIIVWLHL